MPLRNVQLHTNLNVLRCFPRLILLICSLTCLFLTHLSASYKPLYCIQLDIRWSMCTNVLLHDMYRTTTHTHSIAGWLGVFNVNAYAKGWCSDWNLSHSFPLKCLENKTRNGFWVFLVAVVLFLFWLLDDFQSLLFCETENCVAAQCSFCMHTHIVFLRKILPLLLCSVLFCSILFC